MELITRWLRVRTSLWPELSFSRYEDTIAAERENKKRNIKNLQKKTLETQTELTKTAVDFAHLNHRADIRKTETSRIPKIQSSARKQDTSLPSKKKKTKELFTLCQQRK